MKQTHSKNKDSTIDEMQDLLSLKRLRHRYGCGPAPRNLQTYSDQIEEKIMVLTQKIKRLKQGVPLNEVVGNEEAEVCGKFPHMHYIYDNLSKKRYTKLLRSRISALKVRIK